jgi:serine/threonine protein phosphatase PrpC
LCSDGLSSIVPYDEIKKIIKNVDFTQTPSMLIDAALRFGGDDNVTVIGIKFI